MKPVFGECITTMDELTELRSVIGHPSKLAEQKVIPSIDEHCRSFIGKSPFLIMATANDSGSCDASPRGDAPGFVHVLDEHHLLIPERPGNRRMDSIQNILSNPRIGLLFLIPGLEETLRINGKAVITRDQKLLEPLAVNGRVPLLGIGVEVEECYVHCAKSCKRSGIWDFETWLAKEELPSIPHMLADHAKRASLTVTEIQDLLQESYTKRLY
ncbi:pyridoxamine 5'-phosphate oxidase family protein [Brevibacillus migulae]|uniref:pyridoxamine 5'-phosphate oxidase family protein n=1 Tax=Brevibacillus migulae TaxID=1644114 RepID=UPI00106DDBED|nr:pyridoxamine 5'-phosphate oxidase family protein [Brevibacillus migulae]